MYRNIKQAEPSLVAQAKTQGANFVEPKGLDDSYKYLHYLGDAALVGLGAGMSWHSLKKFVEHTYRKRLEKAIRNTTGVEDFYNSRTAPITNEYVGAPKTASVKKGDWAAPIHLSGKQVRDTAKSDSVNKHMDQFMFGIDKGQGPINDIASSMAANPDVAHTLAFAAIPPLFAASAWAGNSLSKAINNFFKKKDVEPMTKEREEARKRYEDAALTLRNVTLGGMDKKSSYMEKDAFWPALFLLGTGLGLGAYGTYQATQRQIPTDVGEDIPNPHLTNNSALNGVLGLGAGALGLMAIPPAYRFVQSMRKGYKNQLEGISDVTRSAQAWNAVRDSRGEDFAALRAALADEPDLLDFESHGTKKKRKS